jgi:cell division protein FtsI/penicillin-binding protein 2
MQHLVDNEDEVFFMTKKRMFFILLIIQMMIFLLFGRLVQLQLVSTESFHGVNLIEASVEQRTQQMIIDDGRGMFVDRNEQPLTYDYVPSLVLFPFLKKIDWPMEEVASILSISKQTITTQLNEAKAPFILLVNDQPFHLTEQQIKQINRLRIPGVVAVKKQYPLERKYAQHLIGLLGENQSLFQQRYPNKKLSTKTKIGISGLQSAFDEFLLQDGETKLLYHVDGSGGPLFGMDVKYTEQSNPFYPIAIETTVDRSLQTKVEDIVRMHGMKKGAVVLLDVQTSDILALMSAPEMDEHNPYKNGAAENQALLPQILGSIFKVIVAAAALEKGLVPSERTFDCSKKINGEPDDTYDYPFLSFKDSFAVSCNNTFGIVGKELVQKEKDVFEQYAEKLGVFPLVGWNGSVYHFSNFRPLAEEKKGVIWKNEQDKKIPLAVAQTAIGQKDVRLSPLAVANMMATIARGGETKQVRAVKKMMYKNGTTFFEFQEQTLTDETLQRDTIEQLQQLLREVVQHQRGTGRAFQSLPYSVAGKSSTAETGQKKIINKWFAGYFPSEQPKYALVVVQLETESSKAVTNAIFADIVRAAYEWDQLHGKGRDEW